MKCLTNCTLASPDMTTTPKWEDFYGLSNDEMKSLLDYALVNTKIELTKAVFDYFWAMGNKPGPEKDETVFEFLGEHLLTDNGEHDTGIWCADDCNERIAVYKALEEKIEEQWLNQTGGVAHL